MFCFCRGKKLMAKILKAIKINKAKKNLNIPIGKAFLFVTFAYTLYDTPQFEIRI